jgi:predicted RNase H-like HicB family nuclease
MASTLSVPLEILAVVHEVEGGGYWAEVPRFPGCITQAETMEALKENLVQAIEDWLSGLPVKTSDEARKLAEIQGGRLPMDESYPRPNDYLPPPSWTDEDE